ncbi:MAG: hypothetical protein ACQGVC_15760 [Myxococcota bacterium]
MSQRPMLGELLMQAGVIDEAQLAVALERQRDLERPLGKTLLEMDAIDEETLTRTLARQLSVPIVWLRGKRVKAEILDLVPRELIDKHRCLPVQQGRDKTLLLAMEDPSDDGVVREVSEASGLAVRPVLAAASELEDAIERHAPADPELSFRHMEFVDGAESGPDLLTVEPPDGLEPGPPPVALTTGISASDLVLRALSQLLVEKGVITRDELVARLEKLSRDDAA